MPERPYNIRVTDIAQYVRHHSCNRRLRLAYNDREAAQEVPFAERLFNALDPVLQSKGQENEDDWANHLRDEGVEEFQAEGLARFEIDQDEGTPIGGASGQEGIGGVENDERQQLTWREFRRQANDVGPEDEVFAREVEIEGQIGVFSVSGRVDFVVLIWRDEGPTLRVVETKASRKNKTNHHIQVAAYKILLEQILEENPLYLNGGVVGPDDIECVVGRIDESTNQLEDILELDALSLESEMSDIQELLTPGGTFEEVITTPVEDIDQLDYQLAPKCDQCVFDVHCFPESARQRYLELMGLSPSTVRALEEVGIETIDDLAELDPNSEQAEEVRGNRTVREDIQNLRAQAAARRQTLPGGGDPDEFEVQPLPGNTQSQLPNHEINGDRVIRVYLNVDYDYTEDRVMALAAHITRSEWEIETPLEWERDDDGEVYPNYEPEAVEVPPPDFVDDNEEDGGDDEEVETRPLQGEHVVRTQPIPWSGDYERDTAAETAFIHDFINELVDEITGVATSDEEFVHFYVWSQSEMEHLIEACSRAGTDLLSHLRHLLGCREPLEQMIYSSLRSEVDNRYALGWTGRGLGVVSSLTWFGDRYHWARNVTGDEVELDRTFEQDVFDFKTTLGVNETSDGLEWAEDRESGDDDPTFEIRSRSFDSLPVPYMHVAWRDLPTPGSTENPRLANQLRRYHRANRRRLKEYLKARTQALRWIDEHIRFHNDDIQKARLDLSELEEFELDVPDAARAAIDFLLLDHYSATTEWFAENMKPPAHRVPQGDIIPLSNATWGANNTLRADIDLTDYDIDTDDFRMRTSFDEGSFVRVSPTHEDPQEAPRFYHLTSWGNTFVIVNVDWDNEQVILDGLTFDENQYCLNSDAWGTQGEVAYEGTDFEGSPLLLSESISAFTSNRVHNRLSRGLGPALNWLNPENPHIPEVEGNEGTEEHPYRQLLEEIDIGDDKPLRESQIEAILDGLETSIHLIHGPPGTGKSTTTAIAVLLRILDHVDSGSTIALAGNTHRAVNTLLTQIDEQLDEFEDVTDRLGYDIPNIHMVKVASSPERNDPPAADIPMVGTRGNIEDFDDMRDDGVLIIGGTTNAVLNQWEQLDDSATFGGSNDQFYCDELIVDEASMMVFPHFLALATTVGQEGRILLAGDHRQLSPIVAHDWDEEDRPPVELYQPYSSAFEAVRNLSDGEGVGSSQVRLSVLRYTFRLPPAIRALITQLYESQDELQLDGELAESFEVPDSDSPLDAIFQQDTGLFLITHTEQESRLSNPFEAEIIEELLSTDSAIGLGEDSVSVLTPHTAQRSHLQQVLEEFSADGEPVDVVDTVERLQGGESENIIVSATASDPTAIGENEQFLLDLNRSNVAFSRTERRLIVICSREFLNHIPPEVEDYNAAMLWKSLRSICSEQLGEMEMDGETVRILAPNPEAPELAEVLRQN